MTMRQSQAIWELCRQGFPLEADEAAERWEHGEAFELETGVRVPRTVENLVDQCNWEVGGHRETA